MIEFLLELDFNFYIERSVKKSDRVSKGLKPAHPLRDQNNVKRKNTLLYSQGH